MATGDKFDYVLCGFPHVFLPVSFPVYVFRLGNPDHQLSVVRQFVESGSGGGEISLQHALDMARKGLRYIHINTNHTKRNEMRDGRVILTPHCTGVMYACGSMYIVVSRRMVVGKYYV